MPTSNSKQKESNSQKSIKTAILLLEILHHIPKHGKITAKTIHERMTSAGHSMTIRSMQRYLKELSEHFDIECDDRSKPYGYRWLEKAETFSLSQLTPQESLLLSLAEQQMNDLLPAKVTKNLAGFFEQAKKNIYSDTADLPKHKLEKQWMKKVRVVASRQPLIAPDINEGVFSEVSNALYANQWLSITYKNRDGKVSEAEIMPLGLAQQGENMYLVCRYKGYDNERNLAMHRIKKAKMLSLDFKYPREFSLAKYDDDKHFLFGNGKEVLLSFCIKKQVGIHLFETPLSKDQEITEHDEHLQISATVVDSEALTWWLNGFADNVWDVKKS